MRAAAWGIGLALTMAGCGALPAVAPRAALPTSVATLGSNQESARLVRQLVQATFDRADRNHDRFLDGAEWDGTVVRSIDRDGDGRVSTLEWAERYPIEPLVQTWQTAAASYAAHLDRDGDGWLSRSEVRGLAVVPGFGVPKDVYVDRYAGLNAGLSPRAFTDVLLQTALDNGRFRPMIVPPPFPGEVPLPVQPSAPTAPYPVVQAPTGPHPIPVPLGAAPSR